MIVNITKEKIEVATDRYETCDGFICRKMNKIEQVDDGFYIMIGTSLYFKAKNINDIHEIKFSTDTSTDIYCFNRTNKDFYGIIKDPDNTDWKTVAITPGISVAGIGGREALGMWYLLESTRGPLNLKHNFQEMMTIIFPLINKHCPTISADFDYHSELLDSTHEKK